MNALIEAVRAGKVNEFSSDVKVYASSLHTSGRYYASNGAYYRR